MIAGFVAMALLTSTSCEEEVGDLRPEQETAVTFINGSDRSVNFVIFLCYDDESDIYRVECDSIIAPGQSMVYRKSTSFIIGYGFDAMVYDKAKTEDLSVESIYKNRMYEKKYILSAPQLWDNDFTLKYF